MRATALPPGALLSRAHWRALGVSTRRLAGPELVTVFPGFLTPAAAPASVNEMCRVLQQAVVPGAVISHSTAALLLRIPVPWWIDRKAGSLGGAAYRDGGSIVIPSTHSSSERTGARSKNSAAGVEEDLLAMSAASLRPLPELGGPPTAQQPLRRPPLLHARVPTGTRRTAGPSVRIHRKAPAPSFPWRGLTISHPYVVLMELATMVDHDHIVIAVDAMLSRKPPLRGGSREGIENIVGRYVGMPGARAVLRALADARPRADSPGETRTRLLLQRAGFPEAALNHEVDDPDSGGPRYIDLAYPKWQIGVEYQGDDHRRDKRRWREDQARRDSLASVGWDLRYLTASDIEAPRRFLTALRRSFVRAGAPAPPESNWAGSAGAQLGRLLSEPPRSERRSA